MDWGLCTMIWLLGTLVGFGVGMAATILRTDKRRQIRKASLREILNYQWDTGVNDALTITRIALKGLKGK